MTDGKMCLEGGVIIWEHGMFPSVFSTHSWEGWHTQCGLVACDPCDTSNTTNKPPPSMPLRASWYLVIVICTRGAHHGENFHLMFAYESILGKFTSTTSMFQLKVMHPIHFPLALSRTMATQYERVGRVTHQSSISLALTTSLIMNCSCLWSLADLMLNVLLHPLVPIMKKTHCLLTHGSFNQPASYALFLC